MFFASVAHLFCKNRCLFNLYCVGGDVKPCSVNSDNAATSYYLQVSTCHSLSVHEFRNVYWQ